MHVQVRRQVAEKQVVDVTGRKGPADCATDMLNITPVVGQLLRCQIAQIGDVPASEHHRCVPCRNRPLLQERLAGAPAVERPV